MAITSVDDITRVVLINDRTIIVNGNTPASAYSPTGKLAQEWIEAGNSVDEEFTESETAIVLKYARLDWHKRAGLHILDEIDLLLAELQPTPQQGLANLNALGSIQSLLKAGYLNVAKGSLLELGADNLAGLAGTSFEGDQESFDKVVAWVDEAIAEIASIEA